MTAALTRKDELARLLPHRTLPTFRLPDDELALAAADAAEGGPWWQRPVASTGGAGDHPLASVLDAEWDGDWVVQPGLPGARRRVLARVDGPPLRVWIDRSAADADRAAVRDAVAAVADEVTGPVGLRVDLVTTPGGSCIVEVDVVEVDAVEVDAVDVDAVEADAVEPPATRDDALAVPADASTWDLGDHLAIRAGGRLAVADLAGAYVWAANADGVPVRAMAAELAEVLEVDVEAAARVARGHLRAWRVGGMLGRTASSAAGAAAAPPPSPSSSSWSSSPAWNLHADVAVLGTAVRVHAPSVEILDLATSFLPTGAEPDPVARVDVERRDDGWHVYGSHVARRRCASGLQVAALVRLAVLRSVAVASDVPGLQATALADADRRGVLVLGPPEHRRDVARRWLDAGGTVVADAIARIDGEGRAHPGVLGFVTPAGYQWIDDASPDWRTPGAPVIAPSGELLERWVVPASAACATPVAVALLVLSGGEAGTLVATPPGAALEALLAGRLPDRPCVGDAEAATLVNLASRVAAGRADTSTPAAVVEMATAALRAAAP